MRLSLKRCLALVVVLALALGALGTVWLERLPQKEEAEQIVFGSLIAYDASAEPPRVVFERDDKVFLDYLRRDVFSIEVPPLPKWQLTGNWAAVEITPDPVSVGFTRCVGSDDSRCKGPLEVFGKIADPTIRMVDIYYSGEWHRFEVSSPGFVVTLSRAVGDLGPLKWRDASGAIVWETAMR
jgi:hypothetical protein